MFTFFVYIYSTVCLLFFKGTNVRGQRWETFYVWSLLREWRTCQRLQNWFERNGCSRQTQNLQVCLLFSSICLQLFIEFVYILYRMAANSQEDRTHWVSAIQDSIQVDPAYDIVRQKKAALRRKSLRFVYIFDLTSFFIHIF